MAGGLTPIRRVVTGNDARGRSKVARNGPAPDKRTDPARRGRVTPARGCVCRVVTFPRDAAWKGRISAQEVQAVFRAMGA